MTIPQDTDLRVTVTLTMPGITIAQNVYYARYTTATSAADADVVEDCSDWAIDLLNDIEDDVSDAVSLNEVSVAKAVAGTPVSWETIGAESPTWVGLNTAEMLPHGVAAVVRAASVVFKTVARKYLPGLTEAGSDGTSWIASVLVNLALYALTWLDGPSGVGRSYDAGVWSTLTDAFVALGSEAAVATIPGYQRRRKPGVGA